MINIDTRGHIDFIIIYFQKQFHVSGCMRLNVDMQIESVRGFKIVSILERILKLIVYYLAIRDVYANLYLWIPHPYILKTMMKIIFRFATIKEF